MSFAARRTSRFPSTSTEPRSTFVARKTSSVRSDCIYCDRVGSTPGEFPTPTNPRTRRFAAGTCESRRSSSARYPDRSPNDEYCDTVNEHSSTRPSCNRPRNHCTPFCRRSVSINRFPKSTHQREPVYSWVAGHGQEPEVLCRRRSFAFFPPKEYSPNFTLVLVSIETSSVSGSAAD